MESPDTGLIAMLNGTVVPFCEAKLPIFDLGIVQGATITERLRTFGHRPFQIHEHLDRLGKSLEKLGWNSVNVGQLAREIERVASHNTQLIRPSEDLSVVVFVTAGDFSADANSLEFSGRGCTTCIYTAPLPLTRYSHWYTHGIPLIIPSVRQIPPESLDPRIKSRSRLHWYLADREARGVNQEAMALLLDTLGYVAETSSGNLFVVKDGNLLTPRAEQTLNGIAQQYVIHLAEELGVPVQRCDMEPEEILRSSQEVFLTSSTYCIAPVSSLDGSPIGGSVPGPVTLRLQAAWTQETGCDFVEQASSSRW